MDYLNALTTVDVLLFLLAVSTVSAILLKRCGVPYTIGLVPVGIALALILQHLPELRESHRGRLMLNRELIMYVLLPALIFDASISMDFKLLKKNLYPSLMLAGPGLVAATFITGGIVGWLTPLPMGACMIFGALISATDPVAVISLFEMLGAPKRLRIMMDGESLFNDATAIAMFNVVIAIVLSGASPSLSAVALGAWDFCRVFVGGFAVGIAVGWGFYLLTRVAPEDGHICTALSILTAYCAFILADRVFDVSGVMAVLGAGVVVVRRGGKYVLKMREFWSFMAFLANSAIFLLLGFTEKNLLIAADWGVTLRMLGAAVLAVLAARAVVVYGLCPVLGFGENRIDLKCRTVMFWGGLRGAVPLALIFSIPADYAFRTEIMQITLAVVLFTLLVPGLTTGWLLSRFGLTGRAD